MMKRCAQKLSKWLYVQGAIEESDVELYEYGAYVLLVNASPLLLSLVIGFVMELTLNGVLLIIPFVLIRKFSGGFHAKRVEVCFTLSALIISLGIYLTKEIAPEIPLHVITICSVISLIIWSPIDSEKRRLKDEEKRRYKYVASGLAILFGVIYVILCIGGKDNYAVCIALSIALSSGLQGICLVENIWIKYNTIDQIGKE